MLTVLLEVKSNKSHNIEFYNPAVDGFKKHPRTEKGLTKVITDMIKIAKEKDWNTDYRFKVYEGKYEYWKDMKPSFIIDSSGEITL